MANFVRYGKPSMTDLPPELGRRIFETIRDTPAPNDKEIERKAEELEERIKAVRRRNND